MLGLQGWEIIIIVAVVFLLFGASRLPQLAKSLGQSRKAFKEGMREAEEEYETEQQKKIAAPSISSTSSMTDEQLMEEIARRRAETKQS
jgi:sec-independent protein translocase protein TatA